VYHPLGEMSKTYRFLVGNPEGKRLLGNPRLRWEGNIKMCLNPLNAELNPICYLLALLAHHFLHIAG